MAAKTLAGAVEVVVAWCIAAMALRSLLWYWEPVFEILWRKDLSMNRCLIEKWTVLRRALFSRPSLQPRSHLSPGLGHE